MSDYLKRIFGQLVAGLLAYASRLARLAALRQLLDESTAVLEEAAHLEATGKPGLAKFLRAELDETLGDALAADTTDTTPQPALNGDGNHHPFALPRPDAAANQSEGQGASQTRRRGRPAGKNATSAQEAPREQATEPADPTTTPISTLNHQP